MERQVRYGRGSDGTRIAATSIGSGEAIVIPPSTMGCIDAHLAVPEARHAIERLAQGHRGDVIRESGSVSGIAVSMASRISDFTGPNEIFVSATVRDLARASTGVEFEDRGEHLLKGAADPQRVYAVRREGA